MMAKTKNNCLDTVTILHCATIRLIRPLHGHAAKDSIVGNYCDGAQAMLFCMSTELRER